MITKQEILYFAEEFSLPANTIEKDYVLGWLLAGIANETDFGDNWVFKGGTCLKKCYFETYRFSEDLDYTISDIKHIDEEFLTAKFKKIALWIYNEVGIEIPTDTIKFEVYQNSAGRTAVDGRLHYIGPLQRRNNPYRIKLDLTADEILVLPAALCDVHHPYPDKPQDGIKAYCYSFPEVFAEKIRALGERARPRDLYDVIHLYRHACTGEKPNIILDILKNKCEYKAIPIPTMQLMENHPKLHELESEWVNMLAHQLPMLPPREQFWQELSQVFEWLHGDCSKVIVGSAQPSFNVEFDNSWQPPSMIQAWRMPVPLELIRYAGANHLCIELVNQNGARLIEPYNLKLTKAGRLLLIAIKHKTGKWGSYYVDEIIKVKVSEIQFVPRDAITLTPFTNSSV